MNMLILNMKHIKTQFHLYEKVNFLFTILFAVDLMSTSCEKDDPIVPDQTLAEQYPDWVNLSWVSIDGKDA